MTKTITTFMAALLLGLLFAPPASAEEPEIVEAEIQLTLTPGRSKVIKTRLPIIRFSITDPRVVTFTQYSPTSCEILADAYGSTNLTLWFKSPEGGNPIPLRYLVVVPPPQPPKP